MSANSQRMQVGRSGACPCCFGWPQSAVKAMRLVIAQNGGDAVSVKVEGNDRDGWKVLLIAQEDGIPTVSETIAKIDSQLADNSDLSQFTGTFHYYPSLISKMRHTDGVQHYAATREAFWLIDLIASELCDNKSVPQDFLTITVTARDKKVTIEIGDGNKPIAYPLIKKGTAHNDDGLRVRTIASDLPDNEVKFFLIEGVLLLTSEY